MSDEYIKSTVQTIKGRFGLEATEYRGEWTLVVPAERIEEVCQATKSEFGFEMLSAVTAVDYYPEQDPRFHVAYMLLSVQHNSRLLLRVPVPGIMPSVPTVEKVYPNANWYEREVFDMFGIQIAKHSDLRRIIMPADWMGHPLRKDYPQGYEEVRFSFNGNDLDLRKPAPQE